MTEATERASKVAALHLLQQMSLSPRQRNRQCVPTTTKNDMFDHTAHAYCWEAFLCVHPASPFCVAVRCLCVAISCCVCVALCCVVIFVAIVVVAIVVVDVDDVVLRCVMCDVVLVLMLVCWCSSVLACWQLRCWCCQAMFAAFCCCSLSFSHSPRQLPQHSCCNYVTSHHAAALHDICSPPSRNGQSIVDVHNLFQNIHVIGSLESIDPSNDTRQTHR